MTAAARALLDIAAEQMSGAFGHTTVRTGTKFGAPIVGFGSVGDALELP